MVNEILYPCSFDGSMGHAMYRRATKAGRPVVVALHTWSADYTQSCSNYEEWCEKFDFTLIFPNFRGPNWLAEGCGSEAVSWDIEDAGKFALADARGDAERVYLIGGSGGGHATLLASARRRGLWAAASAWCPISDIYAWHGQCKGAQFACYADHIEQALGVDAGSEEFREEGLRRSGLSYMGQPGDWVLDIACGIHDGHAGSVPVGQTLRAFNAAALPGDEIGEEAIRYMEEKEAVPEGMEYGGDDPAYGRYKIHMRKVSGRVRVTVFEGGHDVLPFAGLEWLSRQRKGGRPDWATGPEVETATASELGR